MVFKSSNWFKIKLILDLVLWPRFGGRGVKVHVTSKPKTAAVNPPKVEDEHTLKVKLPQGSTERSKKLISKQKQAAASAAGKLK